MINKKIHADAVKRREQLQQEPEAQKKLRAALDVLGEMRTVLPNHGWEFGLTIGVKPADASAVFRKLKDDPQFSFNMLIDVTAVDWLDRREPRFDVVYQLLSLPHLHRLCVKIQVGEESPEVDSVVALWPAANFMEREVWDMYGITFRGHGDLRRILMYDEFVGHPLRKDYPIRGKQPRVPLRIPELRNTSDDMYREELVALPVRQRMKQSEQAGS
jgi:NADH-quinone oxidoreductase subunit C